MKYALINKRGGINRVTDTTPQFQDSGLTVSEISDEQALQFNTLVKPVFLVEGKLVSHKVKMWKEHPETVKSLLRPQRNRLLAESDWTQLNDSPISEDKLAAWSAYRQELRDLTDEIDENGEVEFPTAP
jgi:hypothetical protein